MSYIAFKDIGAAGNLGSQIQQYASLYAIAQANNKQIVFSQTSLQQGYGLKFAEVLNIDIKVMPDDFFHGFVDVRPNDAVHVDFTMFNLDQHTNYNVVNRFDLYKYWHPKHATEVESWTWRSNYLQPAVELYDKLKQPNKQTVALHVRRGDYLLPQHDHFCKLDNEYYNQALQPFFQEIDKYQFVVFSNDIDWCKLNLIEESEIVTFVEAGNDYVDLILMSLCDHQITANSSYSWWAAFLNKNKSKQVICPTNYLKSYSPWSHINGNYYPPTWINIDNEA